MLSTMSLKETPCLCIFGNAYTLGGLVLDGSSCLLMSSVCEEFLCSRDVSFLSSL
jgi:hypothetical protein